MHDPLILSFWKKNDDNFFFIWPKPCGVDRSSGDAVKQLMTLTGDSNTPAMPLTDAEVNHLRRLLGWMRCEMGQEPAEMVAMVNGMLPKLGPLPDPEGAQVRLQAAYEHSASYPAYIRHGVKMLTKALRDHERKSGIVDAGVRDATSEQPSTESPVQHLSTGRA